MYISKCPIALSVALLCVASAGCDISSSGGADASLPATDGARPEMDAAARSQGTTDATSAGRSAPAPADAGFGAADDAGVERDAALAIEEPESSLDAAHCTGDLPAFIGTIGEGGWHTIELTPSQGMAGLLSELVRLSSEELSVPVRLRLAPGNYAATDVGRGEIYVKGLLRSADAPLLVQAVDRTPNATQLMQGLNLVAVAYLAFDGLTIGPDHVGDFHGTAGMCDTPGSCYHDAPHPLTAEAGIHISGTAIDPSHDGVRAGHLDYSVYGRYAPSHHILVQRMTIQNIFGDDEPSGPLAAGGGSDGLKFNQSAFVWALHNRIRQTSRHVIDNVAVHGACYFGNVLADQGQGLGIEAKGGSVDITYDSNVLINVRRLEMGGENTDATYYWSAETPGSTEHYAYEGRRVIARNNIVVDAREGAIEFSGCHDCAATGNTVFFHADFDTSYGGGDAIREVDSHVNRDGAGADCTPLDGDTLDVCWNAGPYPIDLVAVPGEDGDSRVFDNRRNTIEGNLFMNLGGTWGTSLNPYNHPNAAHSFGLTRVDYNYWWNGDQPMPDPGDGSWLPEGAHSVYTSDTPNPGPGLSGTLGAVDAAAPGLFDTLAGGLTPESDSPLMGHGPPDGVGASRVDVFGKMRPTPPSVGAVEP
jgi:hypothetical protein